MSIFQDDESSQLGVDKRVQDPRVGAGTCDSRQVRGGYAFIKEETGRGGGEM